MVIFHHLIHDMNLYMQLTVVSSYSVLQTNKMSSFSTEEYLINICFHPFTLLKTLEILMHL